MNNLLKIGDAAIRLGIGKEAARQKLKPIILGPRTYRYRVSDVEALIARRTTK